MVLIRTLSTQWNLKVIMMVDMQVLTSIDRLIIICMLYNAN